MAKSTGRSRRRTLIRAGTAAAIAGAAVTGAAYALTRRWDRTDPDEGPLLEIPEGEDHTVTTDDGAELAVTVAGDQDAPTIVLAHGWTCTSAVWGPVTRRLRHAGMRVVVYDQRGHGNSTFPETDATIQRLGADLGAIVEHLDLTDVVLVGHSMGGMAVQALAIDQPSLVRDRARALVLGSTAAYTVGVAGLAHLPPWLVRRAMASGPKGLALRRPFGPIGMWAALGGAPSLAHLTTSAEMLEATDLNARAALVLAMGRMDFREGLAKIDVPTTVVHGSRDHLIAPSCGRVLARSIPGARLEVIPGAGHMLPFETPARFADLVLEAATADRSEEGVDLGQDVGGEAR